MENYRHALSLLQSGQRLSIDDEHQVIHELEVAVANQCRQAALVLVEIRINQAAALPSTESQHVRDEFDDKIYLLLVEANKIGEGQFELGNFYLTEGSRYYAPQKGLRILRAAAKSGDQKSIELLVNIYENGILGVKLNKREAQFWKGKLKQ